MELHAKWCFASTALEKASGLARKSSHGDSMQTSQGRREEAGNSAFTRKKAEVA